MQIMLGDGCYDSETVVGSCTNTAMSGNRNCCKTIGAITPTQCANFSASVTGICQDTTGPGHCESGYTDVGVCTLDDTHCCTMTSTMPQLTRDQCQANAGSTCVQGGCPSGSTTLGVCSDVANYSCCSNAYTNSNTAGATTGGQSAQGNVPFTYTLLERIPGGENAGGDLETYVENIYRIALIIVTLSAVLMLSVGGFMYLTSAGNTSAMGSAKSVIFDSLIGLVIAITAWLILNVINPDLVNVTLNGFSSTGVTTGTPATGAPAAAPSAAAQTIAQRIASGSVPGLTLAPSGDCSSAAGVVSPRSTMQQAADGGAVTSCQKGCPPLLCTGSATLSESMLTGLSAVANRHPFVVSSLTGGSHAGSSTHYTGRAADIVPTAAKTSWPEVVLALRAQGATLVFCDKGGKNVPCTEADHIHAQW